MRRLVTVAVLALVAFACGESGTDDETARLRERIQDVESNQTTTTARPYIPRTWVDISIKEAGAPLSHDELLDGIDVGDIDEFSFAMSQSLEQIWFIAPQKAGCSEIVDSSSNVITARGVRVRLKVANTTRNVERFDMKGLLKTPDGRSIESSSYNSTLRSISVPPGSLQQPEVVQGSFFFDGGCSVGDYRFMLTGRETYFDITFTLS